MPLKSILSDRILCKWEDGEIVTREGEIAWCDAPDSNEKCVPGHKLFCIDDASVRTLLHTMPVAVR